MRKTLTAFLFSLAVVSMSACGNKEATTQPETAEQTQTAAPAPDSTATATGQQMAYVCPMECEGSASMQPGKCPVCGMDLEKNPKYVAADSTAAH